MLFNTIGRLTRLFSVAALAASAIPAATVGTVVPIGGHVADIALDEGRQLVYVANYTANRIDIVSMRTRALVDSRMVPRQPASLALSRDGHYLLIGHLANFQDVGTPFSAITLIDLTQNWLASTWVMGSNVLAVAFAADGNALVVTNTQFLLFQPVSRSLILLRTMDDVTSEALPVAAGTYPRDIIQASVGVSGDGARMYGTLQTSSEDTVLQFSYDVARQYVSAVYWSASPPLGPRVVSVNKDGSAFLTGWALHHRQGFELAQFPNASGEFSIGGHAFDPEGRYVYAQVTQATGQQTTTAPSGPPMLVIADAGDFADVTPQEKPNLTIRERLMLPENLAGRALITADGNTMYAASDSGLLILPAGNALAGIHRVKANVEDIVFTGDFCNRQQMTQQIQIVDPGNGQTDFTLSTTMPGVTVTPSSGTTPATVNVTVNMATYASHSGTSQGLIQISSSSAVNVPAPVRVLVNSHEPDQRGVFFNAPGTLVDLVTDPARNRFYVLRQDKNQLLVYEGNNFTQPSKILPTANTPTQMTITPDSKYLIAGADNSQVAYVYRLDPTVEFDRYVIFPFGHYPRSVAASNNAILAAARVAGGPNVIDQVYLPVPDSMLDATAAQLATLGIYKNDIDVNTVLTPSPSGGTILAVQSTGAVMLYDANLDTFVAARKDVTSLSGAYGAITDKLFIAGDKILNRSLVAVASLDTTVGESSGVANWGGLVMRTTAASQSANGVIQKMDLAQNSLPSTTRLVEAPLLSPVVSDSYSTLFTRTLAPLYDNSALISLTTSGFTVLSPTYDAAVVAPHINSVVSAADPNSQNVATGGLISVLGTELSSVTASAGNVSPLPTIMGSSCLTINGILVPMTFVSPAQINGQIPVNVVGPAQMILHTPAGVSNTFQFTVNAAAPSVFQAEILGITERVAQVVRSTNGLLATLSNPVHLDDWVIIYVTGLGAVSPQVDSGQAASADPLSSVLLQPQVTLGGAPLEIGFAGLAPGQVGVYQINAKVPFQGVPTGLQVPLTIKQADISTTVYVRVVN